MFISSRVQLRPSLADVPPWTTVNFVFVNKEARPGGTGFSFFENLASLVGFKNGVESDI